MISGDDGLLPTDKLRMHFKSGHIDIRIDERAEAYATQDAYNAMVYLVAWGGKARRDGWAGGACTCYRKRVNTIGLAWHRADRYTNHVSAFGGQSCSLSA